MPCQCTIVASGSLLVSFASTVSPTFASIAGPGTSPLYANPGMLRPGANSHATSWASSSMETTFGTWSSLAGVRSPRQVGVWVVARHAATAGYPSLRQKVFKPVRRGSPTLGRFDSGAAPLSRACNLRAYERHDRRSPLSDPGRAGPRPGSLQGGLHRSGNRWRLRSRRRLLVLDSRQPLEPAG